MDTRLSRGQRVQSHFAYLYLCSHVQVGRDFLSAPKNSAKLNWTLRRLNEQRDQLWDSRIPDMVGSYVADMVSVLDGVFLSRGSAWMVVGDSCYADVRINVADILAELAAKRGWQIVSVEPCRSMRASAQQGGKHELAETLVVLSKP